LLLYSYLEYISKDEKKITPNNGPNIIKINFVFIFRLFIPYSLFPIKYENDKADFSSGSMTFDSPKKKSNNAYIPSDLKWFDSFKGVENVPNKNKKDKNSSKNFMNY
jgi:hypothetical protein